MTQNNNDDNNNVNSSDNNNNNDETRIDVKEDEQVSTSQQVGEGEGEEDKRFSRSHSTGHSIVVIREGGGGGGREIGNEENDDKYTLKLPEHIQVKLIKGGGHNYAKSCATYKEMATLCSKCSYAEAISGCSSCETEIRA